MRKVSVSLLGLAFLVGLVSGPVSVHAKDSKPLSEYGENAIIELATCLRTSTTLDIFYLIDASISLKDTDVREQRRDIIAQDIRRWSEIAAFQKGLKINVAGSTFNRSATPIASWQRLTGNNADSVAKTFTSKIDNSRLGNYTNWKAGLENSFSQLGPRDTSCKAIIWFTDGGLWSPYEKRLDSLKDLEELCGPSGANDISRSNSDAGIMSQIRRAGIHVYGILLHDVFKVDKSLSPAKQKEAREKEIEESFYRSLMQPLIEESGSVSPVNGFPKGDMKCGENLVGTDKTYASGAFLEATSPAEVAFKFMKIPATVQDGTEFDCPKGGEFYVDPGIAFVEFATDAKSWKILDDEKNIIRESKSSKIGTTTKVTVAPLDESEVWTFVPSGGTGLCALYVYPDLLLRLHDKALIGGRESSITGQYLASLSSGEKANLNIYKKAEFSAKVDGLSKDASLDKGKATFEIKKFTPSKDAEAVTVTAELRLATQNYILSPLELKATKEINSPATLPDVKSIVFGDPLQGSDGVTTAKAVISPPQNTENTSQVCFTKTEVIADNQNEGAGAATDRSSSWGWSYKGLDAQNCVNFLRGSNRDQIIEFDLSNPKQATALGDALFEYRILTNGVDAISDSQTANFETQEKRDGSLFVFWLLFCLAFGFGIPWLILWQLNKKNAVFPLEGLMRAEFDVVYSQATSKLLSVDDEHLDTLLLPERFALVLESENMVSRYSDPSPAQLVREKRILSNAAAVFTSKASLWPLAGPTFTATPAPNAFTSLSNTDVSGIVGPKSMSSNNLSSLSYFTCSREALVRAAKSGEGLFGVLVVFGRSRPGSSDQYRKPADNAFSNQNHNESIRAAIETAKKQPDIASLRPNVTIKEPLEEGSENSLDGGRFVNGGGSSGASNNDAKNILDEI